MSTPRRLKISGSLQRLVIWLLILTTWEAAYRIIGWKSFVFPAPSHVLDSVLDMLNIHTGFGNPVAAGWPRADGVPLFSGNPLRGELISGTLISGVRLAEGFALSITLGAILGLAMWQIPALDAFFGPLFLGFQTLPSVCWAPLAILILGFNEPAVLFVLVMGSFFAIAISLRDGLRTIPPLYQRAGLMFGASGWRLYWYVLLPASLPALASSLRQGFSFAWRSLMGAELILAVSAKGLGFYLDEGRSNSDIAQVVAVMAMMVIIGMAMDRLIFAKLEKTVHHRFGLNTRS